MEMAARLENQEVQERIQKILEIMESDPVTAKIMDAAETVEDMYEAAKRYINIKFEEFKQYFDAALNFYEKKAELPDEVMDCVVGGGFWGNVWNKVKKVAAAAGVFLATTATCIAGTAAIGFGLGGPSGAAAMSVAGVIWGTGIGIVAAKKYYDSH